jgi:hypothetical protein
MATDTATGTTTRSRNARLARAPSRKAENVIALVVESADLTCSIVGVASGSATRLHEAMRAVEAGEPDVIWRQSAPGYWVGRRRRSESGDHLG